MNFSFFIAKRYLLSKRKRNFINIISWLSIAGVTFVTAALIVVLSVFNGLEELLTSLNNAFDPEIKICAAKGKSFELTPDFIKKIEAIDGVAVVTEVIEDYAYLRYREANQVVTLKGVGDNFINQHRIDAAIVAGKLKLIEADIDYALIGRGIEYSLSVAVADPMYPLQLYYVKTGAHTGLDPTTMYAKKNIIPQGVFSIVQNIDDNYVIVPLRFAKELMHYGNKRTSLEVKTLTGDVESVQKKIKNVVGNDYLVENQHEQHKDLYRLLKMEKLFTFLAFVILLAIGSVNIFFSLMMLVLDKKKDISILVSMGASPGLIKKIFLTEGALISVLGTSIGLLLGGFLCWLQLRFGVVSMGMQSSITEGYPIKPIVTDFLITLLVVSCITFFISARPAWLAAQLGSLKTPK